ncbi:MAG: YceI family protein, partial [Flavitalea sp.]
REAVYPITVKGKLSFHGVTREINVPAKLTVKEGNILGSTSFKLNPEDYNISIPFLVREKIAKQTSVEININCDPKK